MRNNLFPIFGEITNGMSLEFTQFLDARKGQDVEIRINSWGGEANAGFAMHNALQRHPQGRCQIGVEGVAGSAATIVMCCGHPVSAAENVLFYVHGCQMAQPPGGNAQTLQNYADALKKLNEIIIAIYRQKTGQPDEILNTWVISGQEFFFTSHEAKALGLIDHIIPARSVEPAIAGAPARIKAKLSESYRMSIEPTAAPAAEFASPQKIFSACKASGVVDLAERLLASPITVADLDLRLENARWIKQMADLANSPELAMGHILANTPIEEASRYFQNRRADEQDKTYIDNRISVEKFGGYGQTHFTKHAINSLTARMGGRADPTLGGYNGSILDMAATSLAQAGLPVPRDPSRVFKNAMTTSDFPGMMSNAANRTLTQRFETLVQDHRDLCVMRSMRDFKPGSNVNISSLPGLLPKPEAASITYGSLSDGAEPIQLATYARGLVLTREAMVNDDLNAFATIITGAAAAAARTERDLVFGLLISNPNLADGSPLFHADRNNLLDTHTALSQLGLSALRTAMRRQKDVNGGYVLTIPKFLIVSVREETTAEQLIASVTTRIDATGESQSPAWINKLRVIADPRLDDAPLDQGVTMLPYYLLSEPGAAPVISLAFLNDQRSPAVEQESDFDHDVMKFKIRFDVGVGAVGWAGAVRME